MIIIDGKKIAQKIIYNLKLKSKPEKILAAVLVGEDPASISFLKQKQKIAEELEIGFKLFEFGESISENELVVEVKKISESEDVGGVIIQLPLPDHISRQNVLNTVPQEKDVDILNEFNQGQILAPSVGVVQEIIENLKLEIKNYRIAVVGLGFLVGRSISEWLRNKSAELYLLDIGSDFSVLKNADLVISGVGKAGIIKPEMLKNRVIIIDFGYDMLDGKISGDFDFSSLATSGQSLSFYTPTPGGTGPILVAKLFENFYKLNS